MFTFVELYLLININFLYLYFEFMEIVYGKVIYERLSSTSVYQIEKGKRGFTVVISITVTSSLHVSSPAARTLFHGHILKSPPQKINRASCSSVFIVTAMIDY